MKSNVLIATIKTQKTLMISFAGVVPLAAISAQTRTLALSAIMVGTWIVSNWKICLMETLKYRISA